jgi:hypothetical protein
LTSSKHSNTRSTTLIRKLSHDIPCLALIGIGLVNLVRGGFHWLAPDSGAGIVAGMNLSYANANDVIFLLASIGLMQVFLGIWYIYFAIWQRSLIPFALLTEVMKNALELLSEYTFKHPVAPVPGRFAHWTILILSALALLLSLYSRREQKQINLP